MEDTCKEVCWHDKVLKEASQLLPMRCLADDVWEQSQDTTTNTEMSRDSVEVDLKPSHAVSSTESQDSCLLITTNTAAQPTEDINICASPSYHADHLENTEESFNLLGESPKRRSGDTSIENSPKRMNLGTTCEEEVTSTTSERAAIPKGDEFHVAPTESTPDNNSEECQVVPMALSLSSATVAIGNALGSRQSYIGRGKTSKYDTTGTVNAVESDKSIPKPRQASVDSVLDSGIGDSCNSIDSTEKFDIAELKNGRLERHCWHPKVRESLATRLPGTFRARARIPSA